MNRLARRSEEIGFDLTLITELNLNDIRGGVMRFGYWLPVFGGWLRNVDDEGMEATWK